MSVTFTQKLRAEMVEVLESDFETADAAAEAVLRKAVELLGRRVKFAVVGQLRLTPLDIKNGVTERPKVVLGPGYATAKQANDAALSLTIGSNGEHHTVWVVPLYSGTPASYYTERQKAKKAEAVEEDSHFMRELNRRTEWFKNNPGATPPASWGLIPFDNELEDCWACEGAGKLRKEAA